MSKIILRRRKGIKPVAIWSKVGKNVWDWKSVEGGTDCGPVIQEAIDEADAHDMIEWPAGWKLATYSGLRLFHKPMVFTQDGGAPCVFAPAKWVECAIHIEGNIPGTVIEDCNLHIINHFSGELNGKPLGIQDKNYGQVGMRIWAPVRMRGQKIINFYGPQLEMSGVVARGSNCSGSAIEYNEIGGGWRGIYVQGPDNNNIKFIGNDIRNNYDYGAIDESMLGNTWIGNMFHENVKGNILSRNTEPFWSGNYSEGGGGDVYDGSSYAILGQQGCNVTILDNAHVTHRGVTYDKEWKFFYGSKKGWYKLSDLVNGKPPVV